MKTCLKTIFGICILLATILYSAFLFYLPKAIDINTFKSELQKIVLAESGLHITIDNPRIVTTPSLKIGIDTDGINIKMPDDSMLLDIQSLKTRVFLPSLLFLTVNVSDLELESPVLNLDIINGKNFKVVKFVEDLLYKKEKEIPDNALTPDAPTQNFSFIKIKIPSIRLNNYIVDINDLKSGHFICLKGENLTAGYYPKRLTIKTKSEFFSDENKNITANLDIDTFLPEPAPVDTDIDPTPRVELPFVNPVLMYRNYNLKTDITSKLKIRTINGSPFVRGFLNIDNLELNIRGYKIPKSYSHTLFSGKTAVTDTEIYAKVKQRIKLAGAVGFGKQPSLNMKILSDKIYFNDLIDLTQAILNTLHIRHNLEQITSSGYLKSDLKIKTDFKKLKSEGSIIVKNGNLKNSSAGLIVSDFNADFIFNDNILNIMNTAAEINGGILKIEGTIDNASRANIAVFSERLPLRGLYKVFAPNEMKHLYTIRDGYLSLDIKTAGKLKSVKPVLKAQLKNFIFTDNINNITVKNAFTDINLESDFKTATGTILNKGLDIILNKTGSIISCPQLALETDDKNIIIKPSLLKINNSSSVKFNGSLTEYLTKPAIAFNAKGDFAAPDLKKFLGKEAAPFIDAQGRIPLLLSVTGNNTKQIVTCQILSNSKNYITPVNFDVLRGKQSVIQLITEIRRNSLKIRDTGLFVKSIPGTFSDNYLQNIADTKETIKITGSASGLQSIPIINALRISIPEELKGSFTAFRDSEFRANGKLFIFGLASSPRMRGNLKLNNIRIADLFITIDELVARFNGREITGKLDNLLVNGSDYDISAHFNFNTAPVLTISDFDISSRLTDVDKLMQTAVAAEKFTVKSSDKAQNTASSGYLPVIIDSGRININRIKAGALILSDTTCEPRLNNNIFYLNNLRTRTLDGSINGRVLMNIVTQILRTRLNGHNINMEKVLSTIANMKDTLTGIIDFRTSLRINTAAATPEAQIKALEGTVDFTIKDGTLGPFGKFENFLLAENIRESEFFKTALGSILSSVTTIDTAHFQELKGHVELKNGIADINPITTQGNVMCTQIIGKLNILNNHADLQLRGRLASLISNMLGPIAQLNPINLVKATPGLNIVMAKTFSFFCVEISQEEEEALPDFNSDSPDNLATKFQVILQGDTEKPLSLVKSFKWLSSEAEMNFAQNFMDTLPEEYIKQAPPAVPSTEVTVINTKKTEKLGFFKRLFGKKQTLSPPPLAEPGTEDDFSENESFQPAL